MPGIRSVREEMSRLSTLDPFRLPVRVAEYATWQNEMQAMLGKMAFSVWVSERPVTVQRHFLDDTSRMNTYQLPKNSVNLLTVSSDIRGNTASVANILVHEDMRRYGIARRMLQACAVDLSATGIEWLDSEEPTAAGLALQMNVFGEQNIIPYENEPRGEDGTGGFRVYLPGLAAELATWQAPKEIRR